MVTASFKITYTIHHTSESYLYPISRTTTTIIIAATTDHPEAMLLKSWYKFVFETLTSWYVILNHLYQYAYFSQIFLSTNDPVLIFEKNSN